MKIGIVGTGNVGTSLGKLWAQNGEEIFFGSRDPVGVMRLVDKIGVPVKAGTYAEAADFGEIIVLAIPWSSVQETVKILGDLNGKIVIDCTNAVAPNLGGLLIGHTISAAEKIAEWAEGAHVVKAFNAFDPEFLPEVPNRNPKPSTFICGDNIPAKSKVSELGFILGYDVVDAGPLKNARFLEPLAMLWIELAYNQGMGPGIAFKLCRLRKMSE